MLEVIISSEDIFKKLEDFFDDYTFSAAFMEH